MPTVVVVHGIAQQVGGAETIRATCGPALRDGMRLAGVAEAFLPRGEDIAVAFYGDIFRREGSKGPTTPPYVSSDVQPGFEQDLLRTWWEGVVQTDPNVAVAAENTKVRTPFWVQRALNRLSTSAFFAGIAERMLVGDLKQVSAYFHDPDIRAAAQERVERAVDHDTQVVIGHSLGSVVAYEALARAAEARGVNALITLGSPLGIPNLIFDRLQPSPIEGCGQWPRSVKTWTNIADKGDVVALVKQLSTRFDGPVDDVPVHNGAHAHDIRPYLTALEVGKAVAYALGLTPGAA